VKKEINKLGDFRLSTVMAGSLRGVMTRSFCIAPPSFTSQAEIPYMMQPVRVALSRFVSTRAAWRKSAPMSRVPRRSALLRSAQLRSAPRRLDPLSSLRSKGFFAHHLFQVFVPCRRTLRSLVCHFAESVSRVSYINFYHNCIIEQSNPIKRARIRSNNQYRS
jgi:hypothetical protein